MNLILKNIRSFVNIDQHLIKGNFVKIERLQKEKAILIKFFDKRLNWKFQKYCLPRFQKYFWLKDYIEEDYISSKKKEYMKLNNNFFIKHLFLGNISEYTVSDIFWKNSYIIDKLKLKKLLIFYRKTFRRIEREYYFKFLIHKKKKFLNKYLKIFLYSFWFGNTRTRFLIKKYIKNHLLNALKTYYLYKNDFLNFKNKNFFFKLCVSNYKKSKIFYKIPGLNKIFNLKIKKFFFKLKKKFHYKIKLNLKKEYLNLNFITFTIKNITFIKNKKNNFIFNLTILK